jgi:hypothetical protein
LAQVALVQLVAMDRLEQRVPILYLQVLPQLVVDLDEAVAQRLELVVLVVGPEVVLVVQELQDRVTQVEMMLHSVALEVVVVLVLLVKMERLLRVVMVEQVLHRL